MKVKEFIAKLDKNYDISLYYDDEDKYNVFYPSANLFNGYPRNETFYFILNSEIESINVDMMSTYKYDRVMYTRVVILVKLKKDY